MRAPRWLVGCTLSVAFLVIGDQVARWVLLGDDEFLGRPMAPFDPPLFSPSQERSLDRIRAHIESGEDDLRFDPDLGWCPRPDTGHGDYHYDWAGCRIGGRELERAKDPAKRRIVAIGCSMTHGEEVKSEETWCWQLDLLSEDIEMANLGVAAYGLDQALMRLRRDGAQLEPDEVWLGFLPAAALRVTTRFRPLLRHWSLDIAFKPRFRRTSTGELEALANPVRSLADIDRLLSSQEAFLSAMGDAEPWIERARPAYAPRGSHALHWSFAGRVALSAFEASGRDHLAALRDADGETYMLLQELVLAAQREATKMGARFRLLVLPGRDDLEATRVDGPAWSAWCHDLKTAGVEVLDLTSALLDVGDPQGLYAPQGHYSPAGSQLVARELARLSAN